VHEDSKLLIVVHDEASLLRKIMKSHWPPFCLQHPQLFNRTSLKLMLESAGWQMDFQSKSINWQQMNLFFEKGFKVLGFPSNWTRILPAQEIPLILGNQIVLAAPLSP